MIYVKRDQSGQITAISVTPTEEFKEGVAENDPGLVQFLPFTQAVSLTKNQLDESDRDMVRVLDDLIEILVTKNIIQFTELPDISQGKILKRKQFRTLLSELVNQDEKIG